jgi:GNAT superfamily N-acetyltransferase
MNGSIAQTGSGAAEYRNGRYVLSTDRARLDVDLVHRFLTSEFWDTEGIPRALVERSIERSLCFGMYDGDEQVGFARVVTDGATFAFVCDDFVVESRRGQGLGKWLMECILSHPDVKRLRRILLVTHDPRLYLKSGFKPLSDPRSYLEIFDPGSYAAAR